MAPPPLADCASTWHRSQLRRQTQSSGVGLLQAGMGTAPSPALEAVLVQQSQASLRSRQGDGKIGDEQLRPRWDGVNGLRSGAIVQ